MVRPVLLALAAVVSLTACATVPTGPSVMVLPGTGKPFELFQVDDAACRQWAFQNAGGNPGQAATQSTVSGAAIGTAIGATAGAVIGAAAGNPATGAAIGAGTGLLTGTAAGASAGYGYAGEAQRRYDIAYQQCMYAKGNQIPGVVRTAKPNRYPPPPPGTQPRPGPQPPPGAQPPPAPAPPR
ncbi:MAG: YMGG-like glycine zipper-containing protein [Candidatus Rokuibacteriota bacterium]